MIAHAALYLHHEIPARAALSLQFSYCTGAIVVSQSSYNSALLE